MYVIKFTKCHHLYFHHPNQQGKARLPAIEPFSSNGDRLQTQRVYSSRLDAHSAIVPIILLLPVFLEANAAGRSIRSPDDKFRMCFEAVPLTEDVQHRVNVYLYRAAAKFFIDVPWVWKLMPLWFDSFCALQKLNPRVQGPPEFEVEPFIPDCCSLQGYLIFATSDAFLRRAEARVRGRAEQNGTDIPVRLH